MEAPRVPQARDEEVVCRRDDQHRYRPRLQQLYATANGGSHLHPGQQRRGVQAAPGALSGKQRIHGAQHHRAQPNPATGTEAGEYRRHQECHGRVNKEGTGARAFRGAEYISAGKTGTAQKFSLRGEKYNANHLAKRLQDDAWFIAFAPADKPKIALAVIVENGGFGAAAAAPIARKMIDYYLLGKLPKSDVKAADPAAADPKSAELLQVD